MAAGATIKLKRKTGGPFIAGDLAAGEMGYDVTNGVWYYSADGTTVTVLIPTSTSPTLGQDYASSQNSYTP